MKRGALPALAALCVVFTAAAVCSAGTPGAGSDIHVTAAAAMTAAGQQTEVGTSAHEKLTSVFGSSLSIAEMKKEERGVISAEEAVKANAEKLERKSPYSVFAAGIASDQDESSAKHKYTVTTDGTSATVLSGADTVEGVLRDAGADIDIHDVVSPALTARVYPGSSITVEHLNEVTVKADGETFTVYAGRNATVSDAVALAGVPVGTGDRISVPAGSTVTDGMEISVDRVTSKYVTKVETVSPKTKTVETTAIIYRQKEVVNAGKSGKAKITYRINYINGRPAGREAVKTVYIEKPVDRVVRTGKKYKAVYTMEATAYCGGGSTASGLQAGYGRIAVDPSVIPLGTKVYVEGYGEAVAADTGGAIKGSRIDLWFAGEAMCQSFGRRTVKLYVLNY